MLYLFLAVGLFCNSVGGALLGAMLYGTERGFYAGGLLGFLVTLIIFMLMMEDD